MKMLFLLVNTKIQDGDQSCHQCILEFANSDKNLQMCHRLDISARPASDITHRLPMLEGNRSPVIQVEECQMQSSLQREKRKWCHGRGDMVLQEAREGKNWHCGGKICFSIEKMRWCCDGGDLVLQGERRRRCGVEWVSGI